MTDFFNLNWFRNNKDSINRILNFWSEVFWFMQPSNCRIKIYEEGEHKIVRFWYVSKNGKNFVKSNEEFIVYPDGTINIQKDIALKNPKIWVIAWKLQYLQFPKVWIRISRWFKERGRDACFVAKDKETAVKFRDSYGHAVIVPLELIDRIYSYRKFRNY